MKKILFPTDFSAKSNDVYKYARLIATAVKADLIMFHATPVAVLTLGEKLENPDKLPEGLPVEYPDVFQSYLGYKTSDSGSTRTNYSFIIQQGFPVMTIKRAIDEYNIDLVIMGTRAARVEKHEGVYLGSVAAQVAEEVACPVLLIPPSTVFEKTGKFVYGLDLNQHSLPAMKQVLQIAHGLNSEVHFLTVTKEKVWAEEQFKKLKQALGSEIASFHVVERGHVIEGIDQYADQINADVLVLERHKKNILEKLFAKSVVKEMSKHVNIPLLIMHVND